MEASKAHDEESRQRNPAQPESMRTRSSHVQRQEEMGVPTLAEGQMCPLPTFLFCAGPQGLDEAPLP